MRSVLIEYGLHLTQKKGTLLVFKDYGLVVFRVCHVLEVFVRDLDVQAIAPSLFEFVVERFAGEFFNFFGGEFRESAFEPAFLFVPFAVLVACLCEDGVGEFFFLVVSAGDFLQD